MTDLDQSEFATAVLPVLRLTFPGEISAIRGLRPVLRSFLGSCPVADDAVQLAWELAANACAHSNSGLPGGQVTLAAAQAPGYVSVAVQDDGSDWDGNLTGAVNPHGLYLLRSLATECASIGGQNARTVWFTIANR
jgi:hypothetical protein